MAEQQVDYSGVFSEFNIKISDIEERQRLMKERLLLLGQNLIEIRAELKQEIDEAKKELFELRQEVKKIREAASRLLEEAENFARKEELAILQRQVKMFEPLKYAREKDVKNMINESHNELNKEKNIKTEDTSNKRWYY